MCILAQINPTMMVVVLSQNQTIAAIHLTNLDYWRIPQPSRIFQGKLLAGTIAGVLFGIVAIPCQITSIFIRQLSFWVIEFWKAVPFLR
jgi:hypothetical protein